MDNICEQLVSKTRTGADTAKIIGIMIGTILLASVFMFIVLAFGLTVMILPSVGVLALGIWLLSGVNIEYEYIITNNEMDIDKIIGRRKRKRMITIDISKAIEFGEYPAERRSRLTLPSTRRAVLKRTRTICWLNTAGTAR